MLIIAGRNHDSGEIGLVALLAQGCPAAMHSNAKYWPPRSGCRPEKYFVLYTKRCHINSAHQSSLTGSIDVTDSQLLGRIKIGGASVPGVTGRERERERERGRKGRREGGRETERGRGAIRWDGPGAHD